MIKKLWEKEQVENLETILNELSRTAEYCDKKYSEKVVDIVRQYIGILNENYGENRNPDTSLGGWIAMIIGEDIENVQKEYDVFTRKYSLNSELAEICDEIIECENKISWMMEIFIVSSDYAYVLLRPKKKE